MQIWGTTNLRNYSPMRNCQFNPDGPPWKCQQCGWIFARKGVPILSAKPPRRNCPKAPALNSPEHRANIKAKMLAELEPTFNRSRCPACDESQATERLDRCLTPCTEFNGHTCTLRGSDCKKWVRWKEFLALMHEPCRHFQSVDRSDGA